jgi:hypothetical protein
MTGEPASTGQLVRGISLQSTSGTLLLKTSHSCYDLVAVSWVPSRARTRSSWSSCGRKVPKVPFGAACALLLAAGCGRHPCALRATPARLAPFSCSSISFYPKHELGQSRSAPTRLLPHHGRTRPASCHAPRRIRGEVDGVRLAWAHDQARGA